MGLPRWQCVPAIAAGAYYTSRELVRIVDPPPTATLVEVATAFFKRIPLPTAHDFGVFALYVVGLALMGIVLPGKTYPGTLLADGTRKHYKCNGLLLFLCLLASLAAASKYGVVDPTLLHDRYTQFLIVANLAAVGLATVLYVKACIAGKRKHGFLGGNALEDYWNGVELNPELFGIDVKFFWLRPSMMLWILINWSIASKQYALHGELSNAMILYQCFTFLYTLDYFFFEPYMTSTWDIIAEHFGLMLIWGDIVFIPFVFSIQGWYLVDPAAGRLSGPQMAAMAGLFATGYVIFRGCNSQKHRFKHSPQASFFGIKPRLVGGKLLASGFWGVARHMNYTGDVILAVSYSVPCRLQSWVPYVYPMYLFTLLIHRNWRDEKRCKEKYGKVWDQYCKEVPYIMFPGIY
eukprot:tig00000711_g3381.t1